MSTHAKSRRLLPPAVAVGLAVVLGACTTQPAPKPTTFKVTIENVTHRTGIPTVISTGVAVTHNEELRLFEAGQPDTGVGLEGIAEDGHKWPLNRYLKRRNEVFDQQIFDTPVGQETPENIPGGKRFEFYIAADPEYPYLSLATMVGFTNDLNLMLDHDGISGYSLFNPDGTPKTDEQLKDVSQHWDVWDAGTEINEPNGAGPNQPDAPTGIDVGPPDVGLVQLYEDVRRPLDPVSEAVDVRVVNAPGGPEGTLQVTVTNRTNRPGLVPSALAPVLAVAHDATWTAFRQGLPDSGEGLEPLAEDGDPATLIASAREHPGYGRHVVAGGGSNGRGLIPPGGSASFQIALDRDHPMLSLLSMYVESNDAFVTFLNLYGESGLALHGRSDADIARMVSARLAFMESGTERNQPIGQGDAQGARQSRPGQGAPDIGTTRRYRKPIDPIKPEMIATIRIERAEGVTRHGRLDVPRGLRGNE